MLQILLNLLSNAGKFTQNGKVTVTTRHSDKELRIDVRDTGIGMNADQQAIIFDEFRQADGSTTRQFEGTGLGLSITQRFCELMGGSISVDSKEGEGSCFTVLLPLPIVQSARAAD
jgi:signal transduction histidine kinase